MYITRIHLQNLKRLRNLKLDFTHETQPRMWTVFVAENGACKTTLLQAIALAASGTTRSNQLADVPSLPDLRQPSGTVSIYAEFKFGERQRKWRRFPEAPARAGKDGTQTMIRLASQLYVRNGQSVLSGVSKPMTTDNAATAFGRINTPEEYSALGLYLMDEVKKASAKNEPLSSETMRRVQDYYFPDTIGLVDMSRDINASTGAAMASMFGMSLFSLLSALLDKRDFNPLEEARSKSLPGWFAAGYGTQRQLPVPLGTSEMKDHVLNRLEPLFGKAPIVGTGFANRFVDTPFFEPFNQALAKVLVANQLLPNVEAIDLRGKGGVAHPGDLVRSHTFEFAFSDQKTKVPATWLSQGYQSTIAWISDLIGQMYLDIGEPVDLEDMEGMVLIDELDLHLHPTWQVRLVPILKRVFPRMQFIVTTHSPMLLPAMERHEIVMLRLDESGDVIAEQPPASPKLMTGSEIYSSFFNIQKLYPSELGDELRRYTYLSSDPTRTDEEDAEMVRLQKRLTDAGLKLGLPPVPRDML